MEKNRERNCFLNYAKPLNTTGIRQQQCMQAKSVACGITRQLHNWCGVCSENSEDAAVVWEYIVRYLSAALLRFNFFIDGGN